MIIQFPNERVPLAISGVKDPLFTTDIQNSNQSLLLAMSILLGFPAPGSGKSIPSFAIIGGMLNGGESGFSEGYFYYNGNFYHVDNGVIGGLGGQPYLNPTITPTFSVKASDGSYNNSYKIYTCTGSATQIGGLPIFSTDTMDMYRLNLSFLNASNLLTGKVPIATLPISVYNIGNWNMNSLETVQIALTDLGLTNDSAGANKIKRVSIMIINDPNSMITPLEYVDPSDYTINGTYRILLDTGYWYLQIYRKTGGFYDNSSYQTTPYNRGYITLETI
jgi:hypothetical protein